MRECVANKNGVKNISEHIDKIRVVEKALEM